ncbi:MAG: alpha/beta fold hydrolase [Bacteroidales bacterium]
MKKNGTLVFGLLIAIAMGACATREKNDNEPLILKEQGSFMIGGTVIQDSGVFNTNTPISPQGQTLHGDHAYVFYQIPNAPRHKYPLVFLHGAGESAKSWETTPDGRPGFNELFLRKGFPVYLVDQPRRGKAGKTTQGSTIQAIPDEQFWFETFRLGIWPHYFSNSQFPKGEAALNQFFRQMTPNTGPYDEKVIAEAMSALFNKIGEGILVTHSQGGGPGWRTRILNNKVKAIVSYEPGSGFPFPYGKVPSPIPSISPFGALTPDSIPMNEFMELTKIPIIIYYGDHIPLQPSKIWSEDHWRIRLEMARMWASEVNEQGGNVTVIHLPEIGIKGNTHFIFSDLNNSEIADILNNYLISNNLL